jgi:dihydrofolate reductase
VIAEFGGAGVRKLVLTTFVSVDGVMQGPGAPDEDRSGGFELGGWLVPYVDASTAAFAVEWIQQAGAILLGRRSYEMLASHWPHVTDPGDVLARQLNALPKYVVSTTLTDPAWGPATVIAGDVGSEVALLKAEGDGELQVHGSRRLARSLIAEGLVDEYRLWVFPVLLGAGERLFGDGLPSTGLRLVGSRTSESGVVVHTYRPGDPLTFGSFQPDADG